MKALIIGAGIGGLATSRALRKIGIETEVYERSPVLQPVGAGLTLWDNGLRALREIGLQLRSGQTMRCFTTYNRRGHQLSQQAAPALCIHRADLQRELLADQPVQLGWELRDLSHDAEGVTAHFANGESRRGDILVGADGIHSRVRSLLFGAPQPRQAGYTAWRAVITPPTPPLPYDEGMMVLGPGCEMGLMHVGEGRFYAFGTLPIATMRRQGYPLPEITDAFETEIYDVPPAPQWGHGRVTLLGDAIHSTTPHLGQGACQALESAVALAWALRTRPDDALRYYEAFRRPRTASINAQSRNLGKVLAWRHPLLVRLREALVRRSSPQPLLDLIGWTIPAIP